MPLEAARDDLARLAERYRLVVCGAGLHEGIVKDIGAEPELRDPVTAALGLAAELGTRRQSGAA